MAAHENEKLDAIIIKIDSDLNQFFSNDTLDADDIFLKMDLEKLRDDIADEFDESQETIDGYENNYQSLSNQYQSRGISISSDINPDLNITIPDQFISPEPIPELVQNTLYSKRKLPEIPAKVDFAHLDASNKLLSQNEIDLIQSSKLPQGRTKKEDLKKIPGLENIEYAVTRDGNDYYAIYHGQQQGKELFHSKANNRLVKLAQNINTAEWAVLKIEQFSMSKELDLPTIKEYLDTEKAGMQAEDLHLASYQRKNKNESRFQNEFVMKHMPIDMLQFIRENRYMPESSWVDIGIDLIDKGVKLRGKNILHRDIKVENIMITNDDKVVLIDFGLSKQIAPDQPFMMQDYSAGTPNYMAPEIRDTHQPVIYDEKTEVFAYGQVLAEWFGMTEDLNFRSLISDPNNPDLQQMVDGNIRTAPLTGQARVAMYELVKTMLDDDPDKRPDLAQTHAKLNEIRASKLNAKSRWIRLAYLDINDYANADMNKKMEIINALKQVDKIWLVGEKSDGNDLIARDTRLRAELTDSGLRIQNEIILGDKNNIAAALAAHTSDYASDYPETYYNNIYISSDGMDEKNLADNGIIQINPDADNPLSIDEYNDVINSKINLLPLPAEDIAQAKNEIDNRLGDGLYALDENDPARDWLSTLHYAAGQNLSSANNYDDLMKELTLYEMDSQTISQFTKERDFLFNDAQALGTLYTLSDTSTQLKSEIENDLNQVFSKADVSPDQMDIHFRNKLDAIQNKIDGLNQNILADVAKVAEKVSQDYKNNLNQKLVHHDLEIKEVREKLFMLEDHLENPEISLTQSQQNDIRREISHGYQFISEAAHLENEIKKVTDQPSVTATQYQDALNKITSPDIKDMNVIIHSIRKNIGEDDYAEWRDEAKRRLGDTWQKDLFNARLDEILQSQNDPNFNDKGSLFTHYIQEYFDINQNKFKPEYQQLLGTDFRSKVKIKNALNTLSYHNLLLTYDNAIKELNTIIQKPNDNRQLFENWKHTDTGTDCVIGIDTPEKMQTLHEKIQEAAAKVDFHIPTEKQYHTDKQYDYDKFAKEQGKLHKLAKKLDGLTNNKSKKSLDELGQQKSLVKKLNKNEERIKKQLQFIETNWPAYHQQTKLANPDNLGAAVERESNLVKEARSSLMKANRFLPIEKRMQLNEDIYAEMKSNVNTMINDFNPASERVDERINEILKGINDLTYQYSAMKHQKRGWLKKLKGGDVNQLLRQERNSMRELARTKNEFREMLGKHQVKSVLNTETRGLSETINMLQKQVSGFPMTAAAKTSLNERLHNLQEKISQLPYYKPADPGEMSDEKIKSDYIAEIKSEFSRVIASEISRIENGNNQILAYMKANNIKQGKEIIDRKLEMAQFNKLSKQESTNSPEKLAIKLQSMIKIQLSLEKNTKNVLLQHVKDLQAATENTLQSIRDSQPKESSKEINNIYNKLLARHNQIENELNGNLQSSELINIAKFAESTYEATVSMSTSMGTILDEDKHKINIALDNAIKNDIPTLESLTQNYSENINADDIIYIAEIEASLSSIHDTINNNALTEENFDAILTQLNQLKQDSEDHGNSPSLQSAIRKEKIFLIQSGMSAITPSYDYYNKLSSLTNDVARESRNAVNLSATISVIRNELDHLQNLSSDTTKSESYRNSIDLISQKLQDQEQILVNANKQSNTQQTEALNNAREVITPLIYSSLMNTLNEQSSPSSDSIYSDHYLTFTNENGELKNNYNILLDKKSVAYDRLMKNLNQSPDYEKNYAETQTVGQPRNIVELSDTSDIDAEHLSVPKFEIDYDSSQAPKILSSIRKMKTDLNSIRLPEISSKNENDIYLMDNREKKKLLADTLNNLEKDLVKKHSPETNRKIISSLKQVQADADQLSKKAAAYQSFLKSANAPTPPPKPKATKPEVPPKTHGMTILLDQATKEENLDKIKNTLSQNKADIDVAFIYMNDNSPGMDNTKNEIQVNQMTFNYKPAVYSSTLFNRGMTNVDVSYGSGKLNGKHISAFAFPREEILHLSDKDCLVLAAKLLHEKTDHLLPHEKSMQIVLPANFPPKIAMAMIAYKNIVAETHQFPKLNIEKMWMASGPMKEYETKMKKIYDDPEVKKKITQREEPRVEAPTLKR